MVRSKARHGRPLGVRCLVLGAILSLLAGCGDKSPTPAPAVDPVGVGVIAGADLGGDAYHLLLDDGEELDFPRTTTRTVESTGNTEAGDLLVHGEDASGAWIAILGELQPADPAVGRVWVAVAPAWLLDTAVIFDSGLRLARAPDLTISPTRRPPTESGYLEAGEFLVNEAGVVIALR